MLAKQGDTRDGDVRSMSSKSHLMLSTGWISWDLVYKPGRYGLTPGLRVADLIMLADSLKRSTFAELGTVSRILRTCVVRFPVQCPHGPGWRREEQPLPEKRRQCVRVSGESLLSAEKWLRLPAQPQPGKYPRRENLTIGDLIVMAGGLTELGQFQASK